MFIVKFTDSNLSLAENTDDLFVGTTLLNEGVLMWLMKTLLTSECMNQLGAGQTCIHFGQEQLSQADFMR